MTPGVVPQSEVSTQALYVSKLANDRSHLLFVQQLLVVSVMLAQVLVMSGEGGEKAGVGV